MKTWFRFQNADDGGHEILIMDEIGAWGVTAKDFLAELKTVPYGRKITVGINSPGGDVFDGMAVFNGLNRRKNVTTRIDGVAASIASVIAMAGKQVIAPENAMLMIHDPSGITAGTAKDHEKTAAVLDKIRDQIAGVYERKTGMDLEDVKTAMAEETWYTAGEAKDAGLVDEVTDAVTVTNKFDLSRFRNAPASADSDAKPQADLSAQQTDNAMSKTTVAEPPKADPPKDKTAIEPKAVAKDNDTAIKARLDEQAKELAELKLARAEALVDGAISEGKIKADARRSFVDMAQNRFDEIKLMLDSVIRVPGTEPLQGGRAQDMGNIVDNFEELATMGAKINFWRKNREELWDASFQRYRNSNTLGGMYTKLVSVAAVDYLGAVFAPLNAISKNFLPTGASAGDGVLTRIPTAIAAQATQTTGYAAIDATSTAVTVTFNVNNNVSIGIDDVENAFVGGPRVFQDTFLDPMIEGLAQPIWDAIWALVLAATYDQTPLVSTAANFDADDLADLSAQLSTAKCPRNNRSAILPPAYYAGVGKTTVVSDASAYGSTQPIQELVIPRVRGFSMYEVSAVPDNAENLGAVVLHQSAMAAAARVPLTPDYAGLMINNVVDPVSQIPMQFRAWYDPTVGKHMFAVTNLFGVSAAQTDALIRITTA